MIRRWIRYEVRKPLGTLFEVVISSRYFLDWVSGANAKPTMTDGPDSSTKPEGVQ